MTERATLTICETCGYDPDAPNAPRPGANLAKLFEAAHPQDLTLARTRCLMSCERPCAVALQAPGKYSYVVCDLPVAENAVNDLLEFARSYARSADGTVAWKDWPESVKGRFAARIPWLDASTTEVR